MKLYMFQTVPLSISPSLGVFHCTHSNDICHTGLLTACEKDPACKLSANLNDIYHCCVYSEKTPDDGQRNCPKQVEFHSKNKSEKLVHLVGLIIRTHEVETNLDGLYYPVSKGIPLMKNHEPASV